MIDVPRDRWGRYYLPHPETGEAQSWQRVTTYIKLASPTWNLNQWRQRMVAKGIATSEALRLQAAALHPQEDRKALNKLCEEALTIAGANEGAGIGTGLHAFAERLDRGEAPEIPSSYRADLEAYRTTLRDAGLRIHPKYIERVVVVPQLEVAGTFDRIVQLGDRAYIADLKTGSNINYQLGEISTQLACYSRGTHLWSPEGYSSMPTVDQQKGLVIWMPAGKGRCELVWVDLEVGWDGALLCLELREWQAITKSSGGLPEAVLTEPPLATDHLAANLEQRIETIKAANLLPALVECWPSGVPTFRQLEEGRPHNAQQLALIQAAVELVEAIGELPFREPTPHLGHNQLMPREQRQNLLARGKALPSDLLTPLVFNCGQDGIKLPSDPAASLEDAERYLQQLEEAESLHQQRRDRAGQALMPLAPESCVAAMELVGRQEGDPVTALQCEQLVAVARAVRAGVLELVGDQLAAPRAIDQLGGPQAALTAGLKAAGAWRMGKPRSSAELASQPLLVALTWQLLEAEEEADQLEREEMAGEPAVGRVVEAMPT